MAQNEASYFVNTGAVSVRQVEVPNADWTGGVNRGASCAPRIGVNTGDYDPKEQDWTRIEPPAQTLLHSMSIGDNSTNVLFVIDPTFGDDSFTGFQEADVDIAPDAAMPPIEGFALFNRTGKTIPAGSWAFGVADN